ncbi:hypothetical protein LOK49_LG01G02961 [Camellia lanceoleosa]|uniref:Uncharacterized protein n=1 Tax=Camellia lanceoleosa TaxID=1840588 RepID=A0ACC0IZ16_9ERIC|nr:hypothetical protein LOK49_LG01G02961 [Camellia lanceoleosa]
MSEIGPWSLMESSAQSADVIMRMMARNSMSGKLAEDIDTAVKRLSDRAYEIALTHKWNNLESIDKIVEILLEKETITVRNSGDSLEFIEIPNENRSSELTSTDHIGEPTMLWRVICNVPWFFSRRMVKLCQRK